MKPEKIVYTATALATGGREGRASSAHGSLDLKLTTPKELGGNGLPGTNPEELFAAGYAACFIGAMKFAAGKEKIKLPDDTTVTGKVGIGPIPSGFAIRVELEVKIPGLEKSTTESIVHKAHQVCPYSNATRGNIDVLLTVV